MGEIEKQTHERIKFPGARDFVEVQEGWKGWLDKIPYHKFDSEWEVRATPPFSGALTRFEVRKGDRRVSVYLDVFNNLGYFWGEDGKPVPYYECYDFVDEDGPARFAMDDGDNMMAYIRERLGGG